MWSNSSNEAQTNDSFVRLLNEIAPIPDDIPYHFSQPIRCKCHSQYNSRQNLESYLAILCHCQQLTIFNQKKTIRPSANQNIPFSDKWSNSSNEAQTNDSFLRLLNEIAPIPDDFFARKKIAEKGRSKKEQEHYAEETHTEEGKEIAIKIQIRLKPSKPESKKRKSHSHPKKEENPNK